VDGNDSLYEGNTTDYLKITSSSLTEYDFFIKSCFVCKLTNGIENGTAQGITLSYCVLSKDTQVLEHLLSLSTFSFGRNASLLHCYFFLGMGKLRD
jgi:hypothetical protein